MDRIKPTLISSRKTVAQQAVGELIACLFFLLFLYASANKLLDHARFTIQLSQSPLLTGYATEISWLVPLTEILTSVMVILPGTRMVGLYCSFALMTVFTAYIIAVLNFSDHIPCGCGGILGHLQWKAHLLFNSVFIILALVGVLLQGKIKHISTS